MRREMRPVRDGDRNCCSKEPSANPDGTNAMNRMLDRRDSD